MFPIQAIQEAVQSAVQAVLPDAPSEEVVIRPCQDPRFGDYQSHVVMGLAKKRGLNPRDLAARIVDQIQLEDWCEPTEIAGPGFLNFRLNASAYSRMLAGALAGEHLFFERVAKPRTVVVDFSSPNVAKPMHVGHIRSTILGECLSRVFRCLGHQVITDNHIGDWGTQFGMLLIGWKELLDSEALEKDAIAELERIYKEVNARCKEDEVTLDRARSELVKLQGGDPENLKIWHTMIDLSRVQFDAVYSRLGIHFDHTLGESFYNDRLPSLVTELLETGVAEESQGAVIIPFQQPKALKAHPAMVRKSDGGFNYATTDLATLEYRAKSWKPDTVIYVTDGRQQLHFQQVFEAFRRWKGDQASFEMLHVWFGSILGEDGRPFRTRDGSTVKLKDLLDEAEERAQKVVDEKNPDLPATERRDIARKVGLGAVKYADLLPNRQSDYVFDWDKMLALTGNTAVYLLYAYTRTRSVLRKAGESGNAGFQPVPTAPQELELSRHLLNFGQTLELVVADCRPNVLCNYLYELAQSYARFYENCPVLQAEGEIRATRLALCELTGRVLQQGLNLLGIETTEVM